MELIFSPDSGNSLVATQTAIRITPREELLRAADELVSVLPFPTRSALDADGDGLTERRRQVPDLAQLSALQVRAVLSIGAIITMVRECFGKMPEGAVLRFPADGTVVVDGVAPPLTLPADSFAEHIAEIAVLPLDTARMVWACAIHLLEAHYPFQTFLGHPIERSQDGVRLRRQPTS